MTGRRMPLFLVTMAIICALSMQVEGGREFAPVEVYTVRPGDNLWNIARQYDTTIEAIAEMNQITDVGRILPGMKLKIPRAELVQSYVTHLVKSGDTLGSIAKLYSVEQQRIVTLNGIKDPNRIFPNDKLIIPIRSEALGSRGAVMAIASRDLSYDLMLLARVIYAEARGEPFAGQVAVGAVVLNRVRSTQFPNTIEEVIFQAGQFKPVDDGTINLIPNDLAIKAARQALAGDDPSRGSLYFYNPKIAKHGWWFENREVLVRIGDHVFTR